MQLTRIPHGILHYSLAGRAQGKHSPSRLEGQLLRVCYMTLGLQYHSLPPVYVRVQPTPSAQRLPETELLSALGMRARETYIREVSDWPLVIRLLSA